MVLPFVIDVYEKVIVCKYGNKWVMLERKFLISVSWKVHQEKGECVGNVYKPGDSFDCVVKVNIEFPDKSIIAYSSVLRMGLKYGKLLNIGKAISEIR